MSNGKNPKNPPAKSSETKPATAPKSGGGAGGPPPASPAPPAHVPPLYRRIDWISFWLTTLVVFIGYWWTLAPDLTLEDCGELATASMYAGVPHPPGYPVWTLYSWFFTLLPISNIAYRVALSSAVAGALSCGLVALMVSRGSSMIIEGIADFKDHIERRWENALCLVSGFVAGILIGFNGFMWSQAVIVEVYTLSTLSMTGVMACLLRWIYAPHQRRYIYFAFFWFGICFNNHQSLLVIALGLEAAILVVAPKFARSLFFWNVIIYFAGLIGKAMHLIPTMEGNDALMIVYHFVGLSSVVIWIALLLRTKISAMEFARDVLLVVCAGYVALLLMTITNYVLVFKNRETLEYQHALFAFFNLVGLCAIAAFIYFVRETKKWGTEWVATLICGGAWLVGAAFYLYMALASMSNPPLNWGYPRTVAGFFHAFTRGQYERIHPTIGQGGLFDDLGRYFYQILNYIGGTLEEFNFVYVLISLVPLFFLARMQKRERAWIIGLTALYITLSFFLLNLLNPAPDRQSRDLNRVFFTASHFMIAMGTGYGLTLLGAYLFTYYERWRKYCLYAALGVAGLALFMLAVTYQGDNPLVSFHTPVFDLEPSFSPLVRLTDWFSLILALAAVALIYFNRTRMPIMPLVVLFALLPIRSILAHWADNEQRGHYFGYWFGHDMFTPPFLDPVTGKLSYDSKRRQELLKAPQARLIYPEMDADTVLYGGTDPGRFNPTYMIFCESFIPEGKRNFMNPNFDRRDVYLITQNALADGTYLNYIRAQYNRSAQIDPPFFSELLRGPREVELNDTVGATNIIARMMRPLDHLFLGLGDRIEKDRRCGTSFFEDKSFSDFPAFVSKLKAGADPLSKYLLNNLSKETQQKISSANANDASLKGAVAKDLNRLLQAGPLYETNRFQGVQLTDRTRAFLKKDRTIFTRIRLNRILLEEAYPKEIATSLGGVYPDFEIDSANNDESQRCFQEYLADASRRLEHDRRLPNEPHQIKPGEDVKVVENKVQVQGQVAVMAINGLLTKVIFDKNPDHEFYVEESFPLDWMYPHLTPYGIIMKINRQPVPEFTQDMLDRDHQFWAEYSKRLIGDWITYDTTVSNICNFAQVYYTKKVPRDFKGDPRFLRDNDAQKAFSKLRSSIAGLYQWRVSEAGRLGRTAEYQRVLKEAEFAFKQAYAFCPYSPEALFRYINLLLQMGRVDEALMLATTSQKLDPFNGQIENLIFELQKMKAQMPPQAGVPPMAAPPAPGGQSEISQLESQFKANPKDSGVAYRLLMACLQSGQQAKAVEIVDQISANPDADAQMLTLAANAYAQLGQVAKIESALVRILKLVPNNPEGHYDLAAIQWMQNKTNEALESLRSALQQNAERLAKDPKAPNIYSNIAGDARFATLRGDPRVSNLLQTMRPK
jgi:tetratricopeptide (TPR) repeat protein